MIALRADRVVTAEGVREGWWVAVDGDTITGVGPQPPAGAQCVDLGAVDLLPGLVDLHSDCLEDRLRPRPTSTQPMAAALIQLDGEAALHGITTHFVCASFEDDPITRRSTMQAREIVETVQAWRARLRVDHRVHLRFELTSDALDLAQALSSSAPVALISYMDHSPGQGQFVREKDWRAYYAKRFDGSDEALDALLARRVERQAGAEATRSAVAELAARCGALLASHDDDSVAAVERAAALGVAIAEFPLNAEAARAAAAAGLGIVMGAPNARRGASHMNGASARDFLAAGHLDALASDYHPPSLLAAVYRMVAEGACTLARAVAVVSSGPARIAGLADRGRIAVGARADLVAVAVFDGEPMVRQTWVAGAPCLGQGPVSGGGGAGPSDPGVEPTPASPAAGWVRPVPVSGTQRAHPRSGAGPMVRPATWADRVAVAALIEQMGGHEGTADRPGTASAFAALLERPTVRTLVAESDAGIVGYLELHTRPSPAFGVTEGWIATLAIAPDRRGQGLGAMLLNAAEREAALLGCAELAVDSSTTRERAHRFYRRHDFADVAPATRLRRALRPAEDADLEERFLRAAARAADAVAGAVAGREQLLPADGGFDTDDKQTDLVAERVAVLALEELGLPVLSEESGLLGPALQPGGHWISLDPIDGTRNCMHGVSPWATAIGLVCDGAPRAGFVVDHASGRRWWATSSGPALVDGRSARPRGGGLVTLPSIAPGALDQVAPAGADALGLVRARVVGCTSVDLCRVADGSTGAFVDLVRAISCVHDIAGAAAVLHGAGAVLLGDDGRVPRLECDPGRRYRLVAAPTEAQARALLAGSRETVGGHVC